MGIVHRGLALAVHVRIQELEQKVIMERATGLFSLLEEVVDNVADLADRDLLSAVVSAVRQCFYEDDGEPCCSRVLEAELHR